MEKKKAAFMVVGGSLSLSTFALHCMTVYADIPAEYPPYTPPSQDTGGSFVGGALLLFSGALIYGAFVASVVGLILHAKKKKQPGIHTAQKKLPIGLLAVVGALILAAIIGTAGIIMIRAAGESTLNLPGFGPETPVQNVPGSPPVRPGSPWDEPEDEKPVIYLYPENETEVSVRLAYDGTLTAVYPVFSAETIRQREESAEVALQQTSTDCAAGEGDSAGDALAEAGQSSGINEVIWKVKAQPDGTLYGEDGREYYCLFWEGAGGFDKDFSEGFVVRGTDTATFLERALAAQGLTEREANEFIIYWLPRMEHNDYNLISFQGGNYTDAAMLTTDPASDTVIRVFMAWCAMDADEAAAMRETLPAQMFDTPVREGFTVVEWGGVEVKLNHR